MSNVAYAEPELDARMEEDDDAMWDNPQSNKIEVQSDTAPQYGWEELVSIAMEARESETTCKWTLGDTALMAMDLAGESKDARAEFLNRFSKETKIEEQSLKQYAWVSNTYDPDDRNISPLLSWSHYRAAINAENPVAWLKKSADNDWSALQLQKELHVAKEDAAIASGKPCSRESCPNSVSLDKNLRVSLQAHGHSFLFCSWACMGYVVMNDLAVMKAELMEQEIPAPKPTPLLRDPDPESELSLEEWFSERNAFEAEFVTRKYAPAKAPKPAKKERREPVPMVVAPELQLQLPATV